MVHFWMGGDYFVQQINAHFISSMHSSRRMYVGVKINCSVC